MMTIADTQAIIDRETRERNNAMGAGKGVSEQWGIRSLDLTNVFRKSEMNLPALSWNQKLHDIAMGHCVNMAQGRCPVGHDGFNERHQQINFYVRSFAENVAYNFGHLDPVQTAVTGWIKSPGHRKNLLGHFNICGIAVYCHFGKFYFTQLFALA